jgi:hypothetical protein
LREKDWGHVWTVHPNDVIFDDATTTTTDFEIIQLDVRCLRGITHNHPYIFKLTRQQPTNHALSSR